MAQDHAFRLPRDLSQCRVPRAPRASCRSDRHQAGLRDLRGLTGLDGTCSLYCPMGSIRSPNLSPYELHRLFRQKVRRLCLSASCLPEPSLLLFPFNQSWLDMPLPAACLWSGSREVAPLAGKHPEAWPGLLTPTHPEASLLPGSEARKQSSPGTGPECPGPLLSETMRVMTVLRTVWQERV